MRLMHHLARFNLTKSDTVFSAIAAALGVVVLASASPAAAAPPRSSSCRPMLTGFTVPELAYAGDKTTGNVSLSCAPSFAVKVLLSSDRSELAVPGTVTVGPGQSSATVPLTAKLVDGAQYRARITALYHGRSLRGDITVNPGLKSVSIPPSSAPNAVSLFLSFTGPAPTGGVTVQLASDNSAVTMPPTDHFQVSVIGGDVSAIQVRPVTEDTTVTISATLGSRTLSASKVLLPPFDGTQGLIIQADGEGDLYGQEYGRSYQVLLNNPAPEGGLDIPVKVRDDNPAVQLDNTTAYIPEGNIIGSFRLNTADVIRTTHAVLEVTASGATATLPITIHPRIIAVTLPESVKSGTAFHGTVTLAGPSGVDTEVFLQPGWGIVEVQGPLTIPAGATSATFEATSVSVDEPSQVNITAYLGRTEVISNWVTLTP